jgi:hypothetical protein
MFGPSRRVRRAVAVIVLSGTGLGSALILTQRSRAYAAHPGTSEEFTIFVKTAPESPEV